jgi:hypothetical protein
MLDGASFESVGAVGAGPLQIGKKSTLPEMRGEVYFQANPPLQKQQQTTPTNP